VRQLASMLGLTRTSLYYKPAAPVGRRCGSRTGSTSCTRRIRSTAAGGSPPDRGKRRRRSTARRRIGACARWASPTSRPGRTRASGCRRTGSTPTCWARWPAPTRTTPGACTSIRLQAGWMCMVAVLGDPPAAAVLALHSGLGAGPDPGAALRAASGAADPGAGYPGDLEQRPGEPFHQPGTPWVLHRAPGGPGCGSAWTARAGPWTISSPSGSGAP